MKGYDRLSAADLVAWVAELLARLDGGVCT